MTRALMLSCLLVCLALPALAQDPSPRWNGLTTEQQRFLLEGLGIDAATKAQYFDPVPVELKQALIDSLWTALPPEKREQVLLYAHLTRPIDRQGRVTPPTWTSLTQRQREAALEAFRLDPTQRLVFEGMPAEMKQMAVGMMWQYLEPGLREEILARP